MKKLFILFFSLLLVACSKQDNATIKEPISENIVETKIETILEKKETKIELDNEEDKIAAKAVEMEVDWYIDEKYFSKQKIINILTKSENKKNNYSKKVIEYILQEKNPNFKEIALKHANLIFTDEDLSKDEVKKKLKEELFTNEEINYAMKNLKNFGE